MNQKLDESKGQRILMNSEDMNVLKLGPAWSYLEYSSITKEVGPLLICLYYNFFN